jgi:hypothetical protein
MAASYTISKIGEVKANDEFIFQKSYSNNTYDSGSPPPYYITNSQNRIESVVVPEAQQTVILPASFRPIILPQKPPHDYLVWSVANLVFCNLLFGIAALVFSLKTRSSVRNNYLAKAYASSRTAFALNLIATIFGLITWLIAFILVILYTTGNRTG